MAEQNNARKGIHHINTPLDEQTLNHSLPGYTMGLYDIISRPIRPSLPAWSNSPRRLPSCHVFKQPAERIIEKSLYIIPFVKTLNDRVYEY